MGATIGKGGYAVVKEGTRKLDQTPVAIKLVHKRNIPRMVRYQRREIPMEIAVMLEIRRKGGCDNVIGLEEYFELADWWVLVLEKPKVCQDLYDLITARKSLSEETARNLFYQVF